MKANPIMFNRRAIFKVILMLALIYLGYSFNFPATHIAGEWISDASYHATNNTTWNNMTMKQRVVFLIIPVPYLCVFLIWYFLVFKRHRKKLIINGWPEGVVMWVYGVHGFDNLLYDLECITRGFKRIPWDEVSLPVSRNLYRGKIVIYYKIKRFQNPIGWNRIVVTNPTLVRVSWSRVFVSGIYNRVVKPTNDPTLDYIEYFDVLPFSYIPPDLEKFEVVHKVSLSRIRRDNTEMLLSNPEITGQMIQSSLFVVPTQIKQDFLELLPREAQDKYLKDAYAELQKR